MTWAPPALALNNISSPWWLLHRLQCLSLYGSPKASSTSQGACPFPDRAQAIHARCWASWAAGLCEACMMEPHTRAERAGCARAESVQTINQLLTEMDGFSDNTGVIVMAATNRPAALDTALTRPGRFDRVIHLPLPNLEARARPAP